MEREEEKRGTRLGLKPDFSETQGDLLGLGLVGVGRHMRWETEMG